ncbi:hypothetical protein C8R44DRAFT_888309 [Mycena epipterygia]|nr:hypothetical protein C8R44DRAFT_888309 [Mycena epipterygia]
MGGKGKPEETGWGTMRREACGPVSIAHLPPPLLLVSHPVLPGAHAYGHLPCSGSGSPRFPSSPLSFVSAASLPRWSSHPSSPVLPSSITIVSILAYPCLLSLPARPPVSSVPPLSFRSILAHPYLHTRTLAFTTPSLPRVLALFHVLPVPSCFLRIPSIYAPHSFSRRIPFPPRFPARIFPSRFLFPPPLPRARIPFLPFLPPLPRSARRLCPPRTPLALIYPDPAPCPPPIILIVPHSSPVLCYSPSPASAPFAVLIPFPRPHYPVPPLPTILVLVPTPSPLSGLAPFPPPAPLRVVRIRRPPFNASSPFLLLFPIFSPTLRAPLIPLPVLISLFSQLPPKQSRRRRDVRDRRPRRRRPHFRACDECAEEEEGAFFLSLLGFSFFLAALLVVFGVVVSRVCGPTREPGVVLARGEGSTAPAFPAEGIVLRRSAPPLLQMPVLAAVYSPYPVTSPPLAPCLSLRPLARLRPSSFTLPHSFMPLPPPFLPALTSAIPSCPYLRHSFLPLPPPFLPALTSPIPSCPYLPHSFLPLPPPSFPALRLPTTGPTSRLSLPPPALHPPACGASSLSCPSLSLPSSALPSLPAHPSPLPPFPLFPFLLSLTRSVPRAFRSSSTPSLPLALTSALCSFASFPTHKPILRPAVLPSCPVCPPPPPPLPPFMSAPLFLYYPCSPRLAHLSLTSPSPPFVGPRPRSFRLYIPSRPHPPTLLISHFLPVHPLPPSFPSALAPPSHIDIASGPLSLPHPVLPSHPVRPPPRAPILLFFPSPSASSYFLLPSPSFPVPSSTHPLLPSSFFPSPCLPFRSLSAPLFLPRSHLRLLPFLPRFLYFTFARPLLPFPLPPSLPACSFAFPHSLSLGYPLPPGVHRAKRFDREIAEEAKRAPAPVFVDDDEYPDYGSSAYGAHADPYGAAGYADGGYNAGAADPYVEHNAAGAGAHTAEDALSSGVHSNPGGGGTPSNYMYPSGYSDLGFSDVSSHGTFAQPPMEAAAYGAAGAYEMVGYGAHGGAHPTQEWGGQPHEGWAPQEGWHNGQGQGQQEAWHNGGQQQYAYPGDDSTAVGGSSYPPTSAGSSDIGRSKSGKSGGARSLVDSYGVPPTAAAAPVIPGAQTKYADGYVSQYQAREHDAYGGLESHHGHVGGLDEGEESEAEEGDGRRVLKVANE